MQHAWLKWAFFPLAGVPVVLLPCWHKHMLLRAIRRCYILIVFWENQELIESVITFTRTCFSVSYRKSVYFSNFRFLHETMASAMEFASLYLNSDVSSMSLSQTLDGIGHPWGHQKLGEIPWSVQDTIQADLYASFFFFRLPTETIWHSFTFGLILSVTFR